MIVYVISYLRFHYRLQRFRPVQSELLQQDGRLELGCSTQALDKITEELQIGKYCVGC